MSKKSRRRNRKILGALAAGLGAAALMRNRGTASTNPVGGVDQIAADAVTGTVYPGANKAVAAATPINKGVRRTRHRLTDSAGNTIPTTNKMANIAAMNAPKNVMGPFDYMQPTTVRRGLSNRFNRSFSKGGRVKLAKRGLGRAFTKSKK